eukprot:3275946-Prymnesium_polylepis.1
MADPAPVPAARHWSNVGPGEAFIHHRARVRRRLRACKIAECPCKAGGAAGKKLRGFFFLRLRRAEEPTNYT